MEPRRRADAGLTVARGVAMFFSVFSLANALVAAIADRSEDVWWLDLGFLPGPFVWAANLLAAVVLLEFTVRPRMPESRRQLTAGVCATLSAVAVYNSFAFFSAERAGDIATGAGWPFSFVLAMMFAGIASVAWWGEPAGEPAGMMRVAAVAFVCVLLFPLAQIYFFGTTDYRRPADYAVVLGARVRDDGSLSGSLADRVLTGAELYKQGLVPRLVMSGAAGTNGIDEGTAMAAFAKRLGVPAEAIEVDSGGIDTDATVRNTVEIIPDDARMLVVSQFYHLPRIKLAYRAGGREVYTVPARETLPIPKTPLFVAREVPAFWVYWARAMWRDLASVKG